MRPRGGDLAAIGRAIGRKRHLVLDFERRGQALAANPDT
jgi:hypothetical protein